MKEQEIRSFRVDEDTGMLDLLDFLQFVDAEVGIFAKGKVRVRIDGEAIVLTSTDEYFVRFLKHALSVKESD